MSGAAFTPGPWDFSRGVNEYGREDGPILGTITKGGTWHIAVLPSDLAESEANARLITEAPNLLAELECAIEFMESVDPNSFTLADARAVVAKVRGEP